MSEAVDSFCFEPLKRPLMGAPKATHDLGSRRMSQRSGMGLVSSEECDFVSGKFACDLREITRE